MGLRVWSGGEIFGKKIKTLWGGTLCPPLIITKVKKLFLLFVTRELLYDLLTSASEVPYGVPSSQ